MSKDYFVCIIPGEVGNSEKQSTKEETYLDYVQQMSANQKIIKAKDLFYQLGFQKGANKADIERAAIQQYKLAASRQVSSVRPAPDKYNFEHKMFIFTYPLIIPHRRRREVGLALSFRPSIFPSLAITR